MMVAVLVGVAGVWVLLGEAVQGEIWPLKTPQGVVDRETKQTFGVPYVGFPAGTKRKRGRI